MKPEKPSEKEAVIVTQQEGALEETDEEPEPHLIIYGCYLNNGRIKLDFSAIDPSGATINDISRKDLTITEYRAGSPRPHNPVANEKLNFEPPGRKKRNPVSMALIIDYSDSMNEQLEELEGSISAFVKNIKSGDRIMIIKFADFPKIVTNGFITDPEELTGAVYARPFIGTLTSLNNAIEQGIDNLKGQPGPRYAIVFTDGIDVTPSASTPPNLIVKKAQANSVSILTIGLGDELEEDVLRYFAKTTKGVFLRAGTIKDVAKIYDNLGVSLTKHYSVAWDTETPKPGTQLSVELMYNYKDGSVSAKETVINP